MKLVIYRDKKTNKITSYHEVTVACTEKALQLYNGNEELKDKAEIVELDEIAEYFYTLKTERIKEEAENLRVLRNDLIDIADRIDDRLYDFDKWFQEEKGEE